MPDPADLSTIINKLTTTRIGRPDARLYWEDENPINYEFTNDGYAPNDEDEGFVAMSPLQTTFARLAFELWDDLIARDLVEEDIANEDIVFAYSSTTRGGGTYASLSDQDFFPIYDADDLWEADIWMNSGWAQHDEDRDFFFGSAGFANSYLHEIGHALGLTHPGHYDAGDSSPDTYLPDAEYAQDTRKYTLMSYFEVDADGSGTDHFAPDVFDLDGDGSTTDDALYRAATPLLHDIAAIQALYGADMTTRTGNTIYGFNSNAGKMIDGMNINPYSFDQNQFPIFAIWDARGNDTLDASGFSTNQRINLGQGEYSSIGPFTDNIAIAFGAVIENAIGGSGNDTLRGNNSGNRLEGGGGNDTLFAGLGVDWLFGGTGSDTLWGGGSDSLRGGADNDTYYVTSGDGVREFASEGTDTVRTELASYTLTAEVENLVFTNATEFHETDPHRGTGNARDNNMRGAGGNDTLMGMDGNDRLHGGDGADRLYGGNHTDYLYGEGGDDTLLDGGAGTDYLFGEAGNDTLRGGTGNDWLYGGADNDILNGGENNDWLHGAAGNDTMEGGTGNDWLYGGTENDTLSGGTGNDQLWGEGGDDTLNGNNNDDDLFGGDGVDTLNGGAGNDQLWGDAGNDTLNGDNFDDELFGGAGGDTLNGGGHNDKLWGEAGKDTLTGSTGNDQFIFLSTDDSNMWFAEWSGDPLFGDPLFGEILTIDHVDTITDFTRGTSATTGDKIVLQAIDANPGGADDMFHYLTSPAAHTGDWTSQVWSEVRLVSGSLWAGDAVYETTVYASTNADANVELQIRLNGSHTLTETDFVL